MNLKVKNPFLRPAEKITDFLYSRRSSKEQQLLDEEVIRLSGGNREAAYRFRAKTIADLMLLGTVMLVLCTGVTVFMNFAGKKEGQASILRDTYGGRTQKISLEADIEGESEAQLHEVSVRPREYSEDEAAGLLETAQKEFDDIFLQENESRNEVRSSLFFPKTLQDGLVKAEYLTIPYGYIDQNGALCGDPDEDGTLVEIKATFTCQDCSVITETAVLVFPELLTPQESLYRDVEKALEEADEEQAESEYLVLPSRAAGTGISWRFPENTLYRLLYIFCPAALLFYYVHVRQSVHEKAKRRSRQLAIDYADVLWQMTMLLRAGMTIRSAFIRIASGYDSRSAGKRGSGQSSRSGGKRYVYEEMLYTCRELKNGISENRAYEQFGRRCGLPSYIKLGTLLSQNLRKGSEGLADILEKEAHDSMEERRSLARKQGEKAGTRLIFPMLLMLLTVLVVLLAPAFFSLR